MPWGIEELRAIERALKYFGPVLGEARKKSSRASTAQEITTVGRLNTAPDDDPKKPELKTLGQYSPEAQTFALFDPGPDSDASPKGLEQKAVHEIAHGVFEPQLEAFMKMTGYWKQKYVRSRGQDGRGPAGQLRRRERRRGHRAVGDVLLHRPEAAEGGPPRPDPGHLGQPVPQALRVDQRHRRRLDAAQVLRLTAR